MREKSEKGKCEHFYQQITWDLDDACCTTLLEPFELTLWVSTSARMLSKHHNTKDPSASGERWLIQSIEVL